MKIAAILINDEQHPIEVQQWLDNNPTVTIINIVIQHDIFYIFYQEV